MLDDPVEVSLLRVLINVIGDHSLLQRMLLLLSLSSWVGLHLAHVAFAGAGSRAVLLFETRLFLAWLSSSLLFSREREGNGSIDVGEADLFLIVVAR